MAHAVLEEPKTVHMGLPLPNGKVAMWLFLVTEIMFFTGMIGTYIILRNGTPSWLYPWPTPHDVYLAEWMGAVNTFVLICSSLTVVLAHHALHKHNVKRATQLMALTLALGCVFLVIKGFEYQAKFSHGILPGRIFERLDGPDGPRFSNHVRDQLKEIVDEPEKHGADGNAVNAWKGFLGEVAALKTKSDAAKKEIEKELDAPKKAAEAEIDKLKDSKASAADKQSARDKVEEKLRQQYVAVEKKVESSEAKFAADIEAKRKDLKKANPSIAAVADSWAVQQKLPNLTPKKLNLEIVGTKKSNPHIKPCDRVPGYEVEEGLLEAHPDLHVSHAISFGNMWASCYFAMTGFHAIHVLGGLVVFVIILVIAARGRLGVQHERMLELTGLYWHFVDVVWIFLFPLLYLV